MRVSNQSNYDQVNSNISKNRVEGAELQNQAATQKRILKPSDDPVAAAKTLGLRTDQATNAQFQKNIEAAKTFMSFTESAIKEVTDVMMRAKELAISQSSDASANSATRLSVATEVDQLFKDLVATGNRRMGDRYIFGGYKTRSAPFDHDGNFAGDSGSIKFEISRGVFATVNLPGDRVFMGKANALALVPENARGSTMPHYPPIASQPEDLPPENPDAPNDVNVRGPASTDGSKDQEMTSEKALYRRAAQPKDGEPESPMGLAQGENVFNIMKQLSTGLRANDTMAIQATLERLDDALDQIVMLRSQVGARLATLDNTTQSLTKTKIDNATLMSSLEDADAFEVFSNITKNENALKATLQTSNKLISPSLLDFLR